jgi:type IV pilus assembly protein PilE
MSAVNFGVVLQGVPLSNFVTRQRTCGLRRNLGFNLIELLIVVAIIGIIASIALPSYSQYLIRTHRTSAKTAMLDLAQRQQQRFLDTRTYSNSVEVLKYKIPEEVDQYYSISIEVEDGATPPSYTITATPKSGTSQSKDPVLTLDSFGVKEPEELW